MRKPQVEHLRNDITLTSDPPQGSIMYHLISIMFILMSRTEPLCRDLQEPRGGAFKNFPFTLRHRVVFSNVFTLETLVATIEPESVDRHQKQRSLQCYLSFSLYMNNSNIV